MKSQPAIPEPIQKSVPPTSSISQIQGQLPPNHDPCKNGSAYTCFSEATARQCNQVFWQMKSVE